MKVSSTEFQQNVGYYIGLVEKGEEVIVERRRPKGFVFQINPIRKKNEAENINLKYDSLIRSKTAAKSFVNDKNNQKQIGNKKQMSKLDKIKKINAKFAIDDAIKYQKFYRR